MRIVAFSDTHNRHNEIAYPDGDVLIFAGDATSIGSIIDTTQFIEFMGKLPHEHKIAIFGNHDFSLAEPHTKDIFIKMLKSYGIIYLEDESVTIEGKKFYGSPYTPIFFDWAFMLSHEELVKRWARIPEDTDVLITHGPPRGILDKTRRGDDVGCLALLEAVKKIEPAIHIFGHIHEGHGVLSTEKTTFVNASILDEKYRVKHTPIVLDI